MPFPVDRKFIQQTEEKLGVRFPEDYVRKMMAKNGGELAVGEDYWELYPFLDSSDPSRVKRTCNDICRETKIAQESKAFPSGAVAIGSDVSGNYLVFLRGENMTSGFIDGIYRWDHETREVELIADDFSEICPQ